MPNPEADYQCPNKNIYICEIWVWLKIYSQKLGYIHINKKTSNHHPFSDIVEIRLWLIENTCFIYLVTQIKPVIIKTFNFEFENVSFTKLPKNVNDKTVY